VFTVRCSRSHPYRDQERPNSVRSLNSKPRPGSSEADKLMFDAHTEYKTLVDKANHKEQKQGPPVSREVTPASTDRSSKWSKFLSSDVMNDSCTSTQPVSDYSTASLLPSVVSRTLLLLLSRDLQLVYNHRPSYLGQE